MHKLPKLYRVVYLEICSFETQDGYFQDIYPRARIVIKNGVKTWQFIDVDLALCGLYREEINTVLQDYEFHWVECDLAQKEFEEKIRHNPRFWGVNRLTIKERKAQKKQHDFLINAFKRN